MNTKADTSRAPQTAKLKINGMVDAETDAQARLNTTVARIAGLFKVVRVKGGEDSIRDEQKKSSGCKRSKSSNSVAISNWPTST